METKQDLAFEKVRFKGVATLKEVDGVSTLWIMSSVKEAVALGFDEKEAHEMFATYNPCTEEFSIFGTVSCSGDDECAPKTCQLHRWDPNTKSWINHGESSAPAHGNTWKCICK
jgi:hypothetical protein